jgi:uncharacterized membrane protein HdeD (DUF308 family)
MFGIVFGFRGGGAGVLIPARAWPLSTFWLLGMLLGADLIARGVPAMAAGHRPPRDARLT